MDKIYSRKRVIIPKVFIGKDLKGNQNIRKIRLLKIAVIFIIAICSMIWIINNINPIINKLCLDVSKKEATLVSNKKATEVMANYTYEDLVTIYKDGEGNVSMIKSNIIKINEITSDVATKIQEEFDKNSESKTNLKLRKFNWSKNIFWIRA